VQTIGRVVHVFLLQYGCQPHGCTPPIASVALATNRPDNPSAFCNMAASHRDRSSVRTANPNPNPTTLKDLVLDDHLADSLLTRLVQAPEEFDVLCCPNLFGDLVSDMAGGMIGSLGLCPSGNIGDDHALFEPAHGSAPDIAGRVVLTPTHPLATSLPARTSTRKYTALTNTQQCIRHCRHRAWYGIGQEALLVWYWTGDFVGARGCALFPSTPDCFKPAACDVSSV
jgi:hypothetical protein